jgi:predicted transcriptional regulator
MGSLQEDADRGAVQEIYRDRLRRLGLVRATYKKPKKGEQPEWDLKTGMIKAGSPRITPLSRLLLRYIDAEAAGPSEEG